jgi:hypothetical protein
MLYGPVWCYGLVVVVVVENIINKKNGVSIVKKNDRGGEDHGSMSLVLWCWPFPFHNTHESREKNYQGLQTHLRLEPQLSLSLSLLHVVVPFVAAVVVVVERCVPHVDVIMVFMYIYIV